MRSRQYRAIEVGKDAVVTLQPAGFGLRAVSIAVMYSSVRAAMSSSRGATRYRHPTNGRAIRRSPAGPLDLMRCAQVEPASSSLPAAFQKENTILTDGVSFCDWLQVLLSALPPTARKGECEGGTFDGFPHSRSITRPQATPLLRSKSPDGWSQNADFQSSALPTELQRHMATKMGLEPTTSSVTGWRSNQLNYLALFLVGTTGLEPVTPCL